MKKYIVIFFILISINSFSQHSASIDFENDDILDFVNIVFTHEGYRIIYTLSSQENKKFSSKVIASCGQENNLTVSKNILIISSQFMRRESYFKFRYDKKLKQVKLIGYDTTQYGSASNIGAGNSSYNLSTGVYQANWISLDEAKMKLIPLKITKKLPIKIYILNNFNNESIEELDAFVQ